MFHNTQQKVNKYKAKQKQKSPNQNRTSCWLSLYVCLSQIFFAHSLAHNQIRILLDGGRKIGISDDCLNNRWSIEIGCVHWFVHNIRQLLVVVSDYYSSKCREKYRDILRYKRTHTYIRMHAYIFCLRINITLGSAEKKPFLLCRMECYSPSFISIIRLWFLLLL